MDWLGSYNQVRFKPGLDSKYSDSLSLVFFAQTIKNAALSLADFPFSNRFLTPLSTNLPEVFLQLFLFSVSRSQEEPEATGTEGDGNMKGFIFALSQIHGPFPSCSFGERWQGEGVCFGRGLIASCLNFPGGELWFLPQREAISRQRYQGNLD